VETEEDFCQQYYPIVFTEQQSSFPQSQTGAGYPTQAGHTYQQAGYVPSKSPVKYNPGGQSAFSSYSNHYTHQQTKQLQETGYPAYRMQQPSGTTDFHIYDAEIL
jgi:hypothetical protein